MIGIIWDFIKALVKTLFGVAGGSKDPSAVDLADSNARSQTQLIQEQAANDIRSQASAARASSDAAQLHGDNGPANSVNTDPDAPVNNSPDAHFRD